MSKEKIIPNNTLGIISIDLEGNIIYANQNETNISGYKTIELIDIHISSIRSSEMPEIIYEKMRENLNNGLDYNIISKNTAKCGSFYWVISNMSVNRDSENNITGYTARRKPVPKGIIDKIEKVYTEILEIEKKEGLAASEIYFESHFRKKSRKSYEDYIIHLFEKDANKKVKGKLGKTIDWFFLDKYENND